MVGEKGLEPSHVAILVPKTNASTNSATRPIFFVLYIKVLNCPIRIIINSNNNSYYYLQIMLNSKKI